MSHVIKSEADDYHAERPELGWDIVVCGSEFQICDDYACRDQRVERSCRSLTAVERCAAHDCAPVKFADRRAT